MERIGYVGKCLLEVFLKLNPFFFLINKKKIILMKDKQEKYKEFTVVNKGNRSSP